MLPLPHPCPARSQQQNEQGMSGVEVRSIVNLNEAFQKVNVGQTGDREDFNADMYEFSADMHDFNMDMDDSFAENDDRKYYYALSGIT